MSLVLELDEVVLFVYLCVVILGDTDISEFPDVEVGASPGFSCYVMLVEHGVHRLGTVQRYDRRFLVKSLREEYAGSHMHRLQLRKEFKLLLELSHPGIVRVYELCEIPVVGYGILMEYVQGETLAQFIARAPEGKLRRKVAGKLMDAMEYLHSQGVVHGDLKPSNIMVTSGGDIRLIDFGLGDAPDYALLKIPGGTRTYSAPEQFEPGYVASSLADLYALGGILKELRPGFRLWYMAGKAHRKNPRRRPESVAAMRRGAWRISVAGWIVAASAVIALACVVLHRTEHKNLPNMAATMIPVHDTVYINRPDTMTSNVSGVLSSTDVPIVEKENINPARSAEMAKWDAERERFSREMKQLATRQLTKMQEVAERLDPASNEYYAEMSDLINVYIFEYSRRVKLFTDSAPAEWLHNGIHELSQVRIGCGEEFEEMYRLVNEHVAARMAQ